MDKLKRKVVIENLIAIAVIVASGVAVYVHTGDYVAALVIPFFVSVFSMPVLWVFQTLRDMDYI